MDKLNLFYQDEVTRETVKLWINQCAQEWVLKQLELDKQVAGYKIAVDIINDSFTKLDEKFGKKIQSNNVNQAK